MYAEQQQLDGFLPGLTSRVRSIVQSAAKIAVAPLKITQATFQGKSIGKSIEANVLRPTMSSLHTVAPVLPFIPVVGNIAMGVVALDTLRLARQQAIGDKKQQDAIQQEIDRVQARIKELSTVSTGPAMTANASAGINTAVNQSGNSQRVGLPNITVNVPQAGTGQQAAPDEKKPLNWPAISAAAVAVITLLK